MPMPTIKDVHQKTSLDNLALDWKNTEYIWPKAFPIVPVDKQSDYYWTFDRGDRFRDEAKPRAPGARGARGGGRLSKTTYACTNLYWSEPVPDEIRKNADSVIQPEVRAVSTCMDKIYLANEIDWVSEMFTTSVWNTDIAGATSYTAGTYVQYWDRYNDSDPLRDIAAGLSELRTQGFTDPSKVKLILGPDVFDYLRLHPDLVGLIQYGAAPGNPALVTKEAMAGMFGLGEVLVGTAIYNSAGEGNTEVMTDIWGNHALLIYVPDAPALREPAAGYTFQWGDVQTDTWRENAEKQDVFDAELYLDFKAVSSYGGYYFGTILTP